MENESDSKPGIHPGGGKIITKQAMRRDVDIKTIIDRYRKTGTLPYTPPRPPQYGDFSAGSTLQAQMNAVAQAKSSYERLPASVRSASRNNPAVYLDMLADETGRELLVKAGLKLQLVEKPTEPTPEKPAPDGGSPAE